MRYTKRFRGRTSLQGHERSMSRAVSNHGSLSITKAYSHDSPRLADNLGQIVSSKFVGCLPSERRCSALAGRSRIRCVQAELPTPDILLSTPLSGFHWCITCPLVCLGLCTFTVAGMASQYSRVGEWVRCEVPRSRKSPVPVAR